MIHIFTRSEGAINLKIAIIGAGGFARELASYIDGETLFLLTIALETQKKISIILAKSKLKNLRF